MNLSIREIVEAGAPEAKGRAQAWEKIAESWRDWGDATPGRLAGFAGELRDLAGCVKESADPWQHAVNEAEVWELLRVARCAEKQLRKNAQAAKAALAMPATAAP